MKKTIFAVMGLLVMFALAMPAFACDMHKDKAAGEHSEAKE